MTTPEWLRPVSDRYLGGDSGSVPFAVMVATGLAAVNAALSLAMIFIWASMSMRLLSDYSSGQLMMLIPAASLTLISAGLFVVLALSTTLIVRRGWCRLPGRAGWLLGGLALMGLCIAAEPSRVADQSQTREWAATGTALPWLVTAALASLGMALLLRSAPASNWLAQRRHQRRRAGGDPLPTAG